MGKEKKLNMHNLQPENLSAIIKITYKITFAIWWSCLHPKYAGNGDILGYYDCFLFVLLASFKCVHTVLTVCSTFVGADDTRGPHQSGLPSGKKVDCSFVEKYSAGGLNQSWETYGIFSCSKTSSGKAISPSPLITCLLLSSCCQRRALVTASQIGLSLSNKMETFLLILNTLNSQLWKTWIWEVTLKK